MIKTLKIKYTELVKNKLYYQHVRYTGGKKGVGEFVKRTLPSGKPSIPPKLNSNTAMNMPSNQNNPMLRPPNNLSEQANSIPKIPRNTFLQDKNIPSIKDKISTPKPSSSSTPSSKEVAPWSNQHNLFTQPPYARTTTKLCGENTQTRESRAGMATMAGINFKEPKAIKKFATDQTGGHVHVQEILCDLPNCATTYNCKKPCGNPVAHKILGHLTHKPPKGKKFTEVSTTDYNNENKAQHLVHSDTPNKDIKDDIKKEDYVEHKKATDFLNKPDVIKKINDANDK